MVRWLFLALSLALALFQALVAGPIYSADGLSLAFGITWSLGLALVVSGAGPILASRLTTGSVLMLAGLLAVAYSQDLLVLYVGWELAGLGLWLAARSADRIPRRR